MHRSRVAPLLLCLSLCLAVGLAACAGAGRKFDTTHARDVKKGEQDKAQIEAWFGTPYKRENLAGHPAGCTERWTYTHAWSNYGGMQTTVKTLVVDFDEQDIVCDHAYIEQ